MVWLALGGNEITDQGAEHLAIALQPQQTSQREEGKESRGFIERMEGDGEQGVVGKGEGMGEKQRGNKNMMGAMYKCGT